MTAIQTAFSNFLSALTAIAVSILNSILAVFQSFLALGQELLSAVLHVGQALFKLATDLTQNVVGFVIGMCYPYLSRLLSLNDHRYDIANFFLLLLLGGGYYLYTTRRGARTTEAAKKRT